MDKSKIVGVLGGYGPYATNDFFRLILDNTDAEKDWEHLHIVIDNNPRIPSRARAFLFDEESPLPYMLESIKRLKNAQADFFVCPCNSAHYFLRQAKQSFDLPFLDMVDLTVNMIKSEGLKKVGLIGSEVTVQGRLYEDPLLAHGIELVNVSDLRPVRTIIEAGKLNRNIEEARNIFLNVIHELKKKGAEAIIYGCTELPIVLPSAFSPVKVYDTSYILATETVKMAKISIK